MDSTANGLSPREEAVCGLVIEGLTNKEMASRLHVSVSTVNKHIYAAMRKLGARNKVHLAVLVIRGLLFVAGFYDGGTAFDLPLVEDVLPARRAA